MFRKGISIGLICLFLMGGAFGATGCGYKAPPAPPPAVTEGEGEITVEKPTLEAKYLKLTAPELGKKLFDERLVEKQREEIWNNQFKGKQVKWVGIYNDISEDSETKDRYLGFFETEGIYEVRVYLDKKQALVLKQQLNPGDIVWFTGVLDDYGYPTTRIYLKGGKMGSPVFKELWFQKGQEILTEIWDEIVDPDLIAIGVDNRYLYYAEPHILRTTYTIILRVFDKTKCYFISEEKIKEEREARDWEDVRMAVQQKTKEIIASRAGDNLILSAELPEVNFNGLTLKIVQKEFRFYDAETGELLIRKKAPDQKVIAAIVDKQTIFVSTKGQGTRTWYTRFLAFQLGSP